MTSQNLNQVAISLVNQILAFQKDGFTDFSLKPGLEKRVISRSEDIEGNIVEEFGEPEECIVIDMTRGDEVQTINFFIE